MSDHYDAFEMSPVPAPGPDAVPPEPFRGIYGMPSFVTIPTADLAESPDFWVRGLGFFELFSVHRELGLGLDRIRAVLDDGAVDVSGALRAQRAQVAERIARLQRLGDGLDRMIEAHERGPLLTAEQQTEVFGPRWDPELAEGARAAYGDTPQWRQYAERSAGRGPEEWRAVTEAVTGLERALGEAMDAGVAPGSPEAGRLAAHHRAVFGAAYFPLTRRMQVCLGRRFEAEPGFAAHYDAVRPGLAGWFRRVVDADARAHGIDPDTATWG
ncbi:TipAS antibiotic-recognition domain-containing protein [Streptomyces griseus]|uniref:MerR family transcriptional regulator n=1 Tax=Streptomyces griseus TaxID=1911 RepID=UPI001F1E025F|nr:TipAS antibiotic-recognition domain-containing protein [Streptomyces griseus]